MRSAFVRTLAEIARVDDRPFLVVGDLGYSVVEEFAAEFPDRFLNTGVAEQNMTGIAAGIASEGYHVFTYSIGNFPTLRCLEQIRNDVCAHRLPVTVVAVGAGFSYGNMGYSHHAVGDIAAMRSLPHISVLSPSDPGETTAAVELRLREGGPGYLRLGKAGEPSLVPRASIDPFGGPSCLDPGEATLAFCATGSILAEAIRAAEALRGIGVRPGLFSCPRLSPVSTESLAPLWRYRHLVTIEEHVGPGGFGSMLREYAPPGTRIHSLTADRDLVDLVGAQTFLRASHGLTAENLVSTASAALRIDEGNPGRP